MGRLRALTALELSVIEALREIGGLLVFTPLVSLCGIGETEAALGLRSSVLRTCRFKSCIPRYKLVTHSSKRRHAKSPEESYVLRSYTRMVKWEARSAKFAVLMGA
jgi:hypothetical protein